MRGLNNGLDLLLEWFLILLDIEMYTKSSLEPQNLDQLGFPCITTKSRPAGTSGQAGNAG